MQVGLSLLPTPILAVMDAVQNATASSRVEAGPVDSSMNRARAETTTGTRRMAGSGRTATLITIANQFLVDIDESQIILE